MEYKVLSKSEFLNKAMDYKRRKTLQRNEAELYSINKFKMKNYNGYIKWTK